MSKYKAGDKFIIEIEDVLHIESAKGLWVEPWYIVNGMEGTFFENDDLDSLERYDGAEGVWNAGYKTGYDKGYAEGIAKKDEIKVGDEVIDSNEILFVVTEVHMETATVMNCVGHSYQLWKSGLKKTGRHFPIKDILEQMRGE